MVESCIKMKPKVYIETSIIDGGLNAMWKDPIVKETRELRKQYASMFKNDADAIFEDIIKRQEVSKRKRVTFPARKPKSKKDVA